MSKMQNSIMPNLDSLSPEEQITMRKLIRTIMKKAAKNSKRTGKTQMIGVTSNGKIYSFHETGLKKAMKQVMGEWNKDQEKLLKEIKNGSGS